MSKTTNSECRFGFPNAAPERPWSAITPSNLQQPIRAHSIALHIDELILHGFAPASRCSIADAVERELTRLFAERELPAALRESAAIDRINGGTFHVTRNARQESTGVQVARALYRGLRR